MIFLGSRYEQEPVNYLLDARSFTTRPTVMRTTTSLRRKQRTTEISGTVVWNSAFRLDTVSNSVLQSSQNWWRVMDINPEILNPWSLRPGTRVRIP
jgi:hypothetical protein